MLSLFSAATAQNPFSGKSFYVQPSWTSKVATSIKTAKGVTELANLKTMSKTATAFWVDKKAKISGSGTDSLEGALADAASQSPVPLFTMVVYNLPNRDCDSFNSVGEICCSYDAKGKCDRTAPGECTAGLADYSNKFIDPIASVVKQYEGKVPMAIIVEPDSLPNLATNLGNPNCANNATGNAYKNGVPYAVKALKAAAPSSSIYLDAAHGGWLGWPDNAQAFATLVQLLEVEGIIRGFTTNVANYQPLGTPCPASAFDKNMHTYCAAGGGGCCDDACALISQYNNGNNEYNYVQALTKELNRAIPKLTPHYIIDTSRNGVPTARTSCSDWCNPRGEGAGHLPTADTALPTMVDALFWIKPPGESDGCSGNTTLCPTCINGDKMCAASDALGTQAGEQCPPEAGDWYDFEVKQLAQNAHFNGEDSAAAPVQEAKPFQPCPDNSCVPGYVCGGDAIKRCLPTPETITRSAHSSAFATALSHDIKAHKLVEAA